MDTSVKLTPDEVQTLLALADGPSEDGVVAFVEELARKRYEAGLIEGCYQFSQEAMAPLLNRMTEAAKELSAESVGKDLADCDAKGLDEHSREAHLIAHIVNARAWVDPEGAAEKMDAFNQQPPNVEPR